MSHASPASSTTILYVHDLDDHIIAETDTSGSTLREYVWLGDTPLAVVDNVATSPTIFYVHTDHLMRPLLMTDASAALAWSVAYEPFGAVASVNAISSSIDLRFPGQWFQLENGLHYNWHRHYDASLGRYVQPDPLLVDDTQSATIGGRNADALNPAPTLLGRLPEWQQTPSSATPGFSAFRTFDAPGNDLLGGDLGASLRQSVLRDGTSLYAYVRNTPLVRTDPSGLISAPMTPIPRQGIAQSCSISCIDAYYACLEARGGMIKGARACAQAKANCDRGLPTIFAPGDRRGKAMKGPASNLFDILAKEWRELASKRDFAKLIDVAIASKIMLSQLPDSEGPVEAALLALHHSIEMVVFDGKSPKATFVDDPACSFCGRKPPEVRLGAGPSAFICNECVGTFAEVFKGGGDGT